MKKVEAVMRGGLELAYIGDCVYELLIREHLMEKNPCKPSALHNAAVAYVRAPAQALAAHKLESHINDEEKAVFNRGRNAKTNTLPKGAKPVEYALATGLEALFGYLYLTGQKERIDELFQICLLSGE